VIALYVIRARDGVTRLTHDKALLCVPVASAYSHFSFHQPPPKLDGSRFLFCSGGMGG